MTDAAENLPEPKPPSTARFSETVVVRCMPRHTRMLRAIMRTNRLDNMSQAVRFALDEMIASRTPPAPIAAPKKKAARRA
jgi:hypothetical protein